MELKHAITPERRHTVSSAYDRQCSDQKTTETTLLTAESVVAGVSHSCLRGWRMSMEDEAVLELIGPALGCFAVLDGHGGGFCSKWAAEELPRRLQHVPQSVERASDADEARQVAQQLSEAVRQMDADLRTRGRPAWACGSTLVTLLVTERSLTVANLGDSRAVLCRAGMALPLSRDHKPKSAAERQRILQAGGFIHDGRVNGDLSLSRALGDFRHKVVADLPPSKQPVSAEPEVRCTARLRTDLFVVLACDGVWDVMSSADVVAFVAAFLERAPTAPVSPPKGDDVTMERSAPKGTAAFPTGSAAAAASVEEDGAVAEAGGHVRGGSSGGGGSDRSVGGVANGHGPTGGGDGDGGGGGSSSGCEAVAAGSELQRVATGLIVERLLDECLRRGSTDNISAVLVLLDATLRPREGVLRAARHAAGPPPTHALPALIGGPPRTHGHANSHSSGAKAHGQKQQQQQQQQQQQSSTAPNAPGLVPPPKAEQKHPAQQPQSPATPSAPLLNGHGSPHGNGHASAAFDKGSPGYDGLGAARDGGGGIALLGPRGLRRALLLVCVLLTCLSLAASQLLTAASPTPITVAHIQPYTVLQQQPAQPHTIQQQAYGAQSLSQNATAPERRRHQNADGSRGRAAAGGVGRHEGARATRHGMQDGGGN